LRESCQENFPWNSAFKTAAYRRCPTVSSTIFAGDYKLARIDAQALEKIFLQIQRQIRGPAPADELIVLDGKEPQQGGGYLVLTAVSVPGQHYLGSALVNKKTNEIPLARPLFHRLDLDGRKVSLDALHTQDQTARADRLKHFSA
jgi:hypothetical protein